MKTENFIIISDTVKENLMSRIFDLPTDGKVKVTIGDSGTKSARQRGLQYLWYKEVVNSGVGGRHESSVRSLELKVKWRWVVPILIRDNVYFAELFAAYKTKWGDNPERMEWFIEFHVHTEELSTSQMAEVLTDFQNYYSQYVALTEPQKGLLR